MLKTALDLEPAKRCFDAFSTQSTSQPKISSPKRPLFVPPLNLDLLAVKPIHPL
jgi:hypothetical protein